jgi:hypothetical protein
VSVLPERAYWRRNVQRREPAHALSHESLSNLENVLLSIDRKYDIKFGEVLFRLQPSSSDAVGKWLHYLLRPELKHFSAYVERDAL